MDGMVIDVQHLNLRYGDFHAVRDLSFHVERGELYALLGTNGAGKTSTLEIVEGHRAPTSGTVTVFGASPRDRAAVRPRIGIMLQESGFTPDLTVRESVRLIGGLTGREDTVDRVLAIVDLTAKAGTLVSQLSGGEKRRLDFATAVWGAPELIFLDEPTTGLDIQSRDALWAAVDRLREDGSTIVLTTHYLPASPPLLVVAVLSTVVMMVALSLATAGLTNSPEHAQVTTLPVSLGVIAVSSWVGITGTADLTLLKRLLPGGAATELVLDAWNGGAPLTDSLILLAPTLSWVVIAISLAARMFRWEPRR
ncbi:hypothetical protein JCM9533A_31980 [Catenuloplanes niger JCM 9533]